MDDCSNDPAKAKQPVRKIFGVIQGDGYAGPDKLPVNGHFNPSGCGRINFRAAGGVAVGGQQVVLADIRAILRMPINGHNISGGFRDDNLFLE